MSQAVRDRVREAVAVFDDAEAFQAAIDELLSSGFDRSDLSLLAGKDAVARKLGHALESVVEAEDDPNVPRAAYVSTESVGDAEGALIGGLFYVGAMLAGGVMVASGGTAAGAVVAALLAGSAAGSIGAVLARWLGHHHAGHLQGQLDRGGLLLWVSVRDDAHEARALGILARHSAHDVHVHEIPRA